MLNQDEIDLRWILALVHRWWWLILGCTLLAGAAVFWITSSVKPTYEATTTLLVSPVQDSRINEYSASVAGERLALTYIEMLTSQTVLETVINQLNLHVTPEELTRNIRVEPIKYTQLIRLTAKSSSPSQAVLLANTIAEAFTTKIQKQQAERYTSSLTSVQAKMDKQLVDYEETQTQIDALNARKIEAEARLTYLQNLLSDQLNDYRALESDYQDLQLSISQLADVVTVVEQAQAPDKTTATPYQASTTLLVGSEQMIKTYSEMIVGRLVLEAAISKLELEEDTDSLFMKINVNPVQGTQLIRLNVVDNDATKAALMANTIAEIFIDNVEKLLEEPYANRLVNMKQRLDDLSLQTEETQAEIASLSTSNGQIETELVRLETRLDDQRNDYQALKDDNWALRLAAADAAQVVSITEPAQELDRPVDNNSLKWTAVAAMAGALLALGFAFLFEYLNETIQATADVNRLLGLKILGTVGQIEERDQAPVIISHPLSPNAEAFRIMAANLRYASLDHPLHTLLVTSPNPQEGKSIVVANLAVALALTELRVIVVDADLRRPNQHQIFGVKQSDGLTDSLLQGMIDSRLKETKLSGLKVLTSGDTPPDPAGVVGSSRMHELLEKLQQQADIVLIDCPPIFPVADATILAPHVDGVLIVLRVNRTHNQSAIEAVESLHRVGAHLVGVVMNATPATKNRYYYYYPPKSDMGEGNGVLLTAPSPKIDDKVLNEDSARPLVTDELWSFIAPLLPPESPSNNGGRARVSNRAALTGILYVLKTRIPWKTLPTEMGCGSGMTCLRRLRDWQEAGVWEQVQHVLMERLPAADQIDWSRAVIETNGISLPEGAKSTT